MTSSIGKPSVIKPMLDPCPKACEKAHSDALVNLGFAQTALELIGKDSDSKKSARFQKAIKMEKKNILLEANELYEVCHSIAKKAQAGDPNAHSQWQNLNPIQKMKDLSINFTDNVAACHLAMEVKAARKDVFEAMIQNGPNVLIP